MSSLAQVIILCCNCLRGCLSEEVVSVNDDLVIRCHCGCQACYLLLRFKWQFIVNFNRLSIQILNVYVSPVILYPAVIVMSANFEGLLRVLLSKFSAVLQPIVLYYM